MSTRGFISIKHNNKIVGAYNHSDSYPTWLGARMVEFIQDTDLDALTPNIALVEQVDESAEPTPEQAADLKARGFWQNVSSGKDWYSHLRSAQGNLAAYIEAGYIPAFDVQQVINVGDIFIEWGYVVDVDSQTLEVYEVGREGQPMHHAATLTFEEIRTPGFPKDDRMVEIESTER